MLTSERVLAGRKGKAVLDLHDAVEVKAEEDAERVGVAREVGGRGLVAVLLEGLSRGRGQRVGRVLHNLEEDLYMLEEHLTHVVGREIHTRELSLTDSTSRAASTSRKPSMRAGTLAGAGAAAGVAEEVGAACTGRDAAIAAAMDVIVMSFWGWWGGVMVWRMGLVTSSIVFGGHTRPGEQRKT